MSLVHPPSQAPSQTRRVLVSAQSLPETNCEGTTIGLPNETWHYIYKVLRMQPGDCVVVLDGQGRQLTGKLLLKPNDALLIERDESCDAHESPLNLTLYQAIPKGDRWEWALEKATELGVHHIVPLTTTRSVVNVPAAKIQKKMTRWTKIIQSAARQSIRDRIPTLHPPMTFKQALITRTPQDLHVLCHTQHAPSTLPAQLEPGQGVTLWVGPEGGWHPDEVMEFTAGTALTSHILQAGPRVLRAETAALAMVTLMQARYGDL